jgi:adenosylmethionine-8-amino-7-oxononanoate aminotransferase
MTTASDIRQQSLEHLWIPTQSYADLAADDGLLVIRKGEGIYLHDDDGNEYIDGISGLFLVAVGHGREELADVAHEQMSRLAYQNTFAYANEPAVNLATRLAEITPSTIRKAVFVNGGSEAVENALKIAKHYHHIRGNSKKFKTLSRMGSYHGMTVGALSVNAAVYANRTPYEPLMPGALHVQNVNCDRCPFEKTYPECDVFCARTIEDVIKAQGPDTIAAMIAEPISTANGSYVPPREYWRTLRELCDKYDIVLIADEVINGFGRTGKWFGMDHFDVEPDIMTTAKQLSSGYSPIAATLVSDKIARTFEEAGAEGAIGGITWGANPVSCAVALANLDIIERENLVENAADVGEHVRSRLVQLREEHRTVHQTRGIGLMHAIDLKKNPATGEDFDEADQLPQRITNYMREEGVLARGGASISVSPPLITNLEEADELVNRISRSIGRMESDLGL